MTFFTALRQRWLSADTLLCVGLDPDPQRLPVQRDRHQALFDFCRTIVDATAQYACAFKPQIAYFSAQGAESVLEALIAHIHEHHAAVPVVLDAKRGDIGSTAEMYAREAFERYGADAVTVNPFLGRDSVQPFLDRVDKGVILLCRTSNAGGSELQSLNIEGVPVYQRIARRVADEWNVAGNCGLVVGATFPAELAQVRGLVGDMPLLVPGIGAQGGDINATVTAGQTADGLGLMISSSRAILYAAEGDRCAEAAAQTARVTRDTINVVRSRAVS